MPDFNLSPVRYTRFIRVAFALPQKDEVNNPELYVSDPARLVSHFARLCREFVALPKQFSLPQLNKGLWSLLSGEIQFGKYLADDAIPLNARLDCVNAMLVPFRDFVALCEVEEMENCFYMWWHLLARAFWHTQRWNAKEDELMSAMFGDDDSGDADFEIDQERLDSIEISIDDLSDDGRAVLNAMLNVLLQIAVLDDERTVSYALHGLGHLRHPEASAWLQNFIDAHRDDFDEPSLQWLEQCRDGTVM